MPSSHRRLATVLAVIVAGATLPGTALAAQDLRSPDAIEAASATDARAASPTSSLAGSTSRTVALQDLRTPDARDAALRPRVIADTHGFAWGDALLGGAGALGATLLAGAGLLSLRHRRRPIGVS